MAQTVSLFPYSLRVTKKHTDIDYLCLDEIHNNQSFSDFLNEYFKCRLKEKYLDNDAERSLKIENKADYGSDRKDGLLKVGEFGYGAELQNIRTEEIHHRKKDDCQYIPLYYLFETKKHQTQAIVILQKFGRYSCKTALMNDMNEFIQKQYSKELRIELNPLVLNSMIETVLGGRIKKIRYLKYSVPDDIADACGMPNTMVDEATMETVVKAKRGKFLSTPQWITDAIQQKVTMKDFVEIKNIEYNDVVIETDFGSGPRSVALSNPGKIQVGNDITDIVRYMDDGHPVIKDLRSEAEDYLGEVRKGIGWEND